MKSARHQAILSLITKENINTQEALMHALREQGFKTTQATVSRDIKELNLIKTLNSNGKYTYTQKQELNFSSGELQQNHEKFQAIFSGSALSVDYAINFVVVKCHVGMANAACAALDYLKLQNIVGTLAGDDTIFILMRTEEDAQHLADTIKRMIHS